jgi:hypothetical protein
MWQHDKTKNSWLPHGQAETYQNLRARYLPCSRQLHGILGDNHFDRRGLNDESLLKESLDSVRRLSSVRQPLLQRWCIEVRFLLERIVPPASARINPHLCGRQRPPPLQLVSPQVLERLAVPPVLALDCDQTIEWQLLAAKPLEPQCNAVLNDGSNALRPGNRDASGLERSDVPEHG